MTHPSVAARSPEALLLACLLGAAALAAFPHAHAAGGTGAGQESPVSLSKTKTAPPLTLTVNRASVLRLEEPASRISVANPGVADITPLNNREIYVLGKSVGSTNLIIWNKAGAATTVDLRVIAEAVPPPPAAEDKETVEVIKGLNRSDMEFNK